jgi:WD40 repeat protein
VIGPKAVLLPTPDSVGHTSFEMSVAFSPDGRTVAAGRIEFFHERGQEASFGAVVSLCDVASGRERATIKGPIGETCCVAFSPDGRTLAVGLDRGVKLYDPETGRERVELATENACGSLCLTFSSDGRRLAAATMLGDVVVWDLKANRELAVMKAHTRSVCGVAFSPDGGSVASASDGPIVCHTSYGLFSMSVGCGPDYGIVRRFDVATGKQRASLKHDWTARSVAFSPDGRFLASGGGGAAKLWDLATNKARSVTKTEDGLDVYCVAFSPDGRTLAVGVGSRDFDGSYGEVRLWDVGLGGVRAILKGEAGKIRSLAFAPDGKSLVTGSRRAVAVWDVPPATDRSARLSRRNRGG